MTINHALIITAGIAVYGFLKGFFGEAWRDRQFLRELWRDRAMILRHLFREQP